jgi:hypothetical protein
MSRNLPDDVSAADPHFHEEPGEALCECGHSLEEHDRFGSCQHDEGDETLCPCTTYAPEGAY